MKKLLLTRIPNQTRIHFCFKGSLFRSFSQEISSCSFVPFQCAPHTHTLAKSTPVILFIFIIIFANIALFLPFFLLPFVFSAARTYNLHAARKTRTFHVHKHSSIFLFLFIFRHTPKKSFFLSLFLFLPFYVQQYYIKMRD